jgi:hypothetical protein
VYLLSFGFSFVVVIGAAAISIFEKGPYETKIVEYQKPDGRPGRKEQTYVFGSLVLESELHPDKPLYHGSAVWYSLNGAVIEEGAWYEGKKDSEWKQYDPNGHLLCVTVWNKGQFVIRKEHQDGLWVKKTFEQLDPVFQEEIQQTIESPPRGPLPDDPDQKITQIEALESLPRQSPD